MTATLERMLVRCEYGRLAPELFNIELRAVISELGDFALDLANHDSLVRLWNPGLLDGWQQAFRSAANAVDWCRYREAVRTIGDCRRKLQQLRELATAVQQTDLADETATKLHEIVQERSLQRLPVVAATQQIIDLARRTIAEGQYGQASNISAICMRMTAALLERRVATESEFDRIRSGSEDIAALCEMTRQFAPLDESDAVTDGSLTRIWHLLRDGYTMLARRLVAELQMDLAGRRRFLALYDRRTTMALAFGSNETIRGIVAVRSWDGAFDYYCEASLRGHTQTIEEQMVRATAAYAAVAAEIGQLDHANA